MNRKISYLFTLLALAMVAFPLSAQTANELVKEMITVFEKSAISAQYTLSVQEQGTEFPQTFQGKILMSGDKFNLQAVGLDVRYDGKTQYVYMEDADELSISEPTSDELLQTNPILMAKAMFVTCDVKFVGGTNSGIYHIEFIPKEKSADLESLTVKIRKSDKMLVQLTMISGQGVVSELFLMGQVAGVKTSDADFVIAETDYPNAFLNDLR